MPPVRTCTLHGRACGSASTELSVEAHGHSCWQVGHVGYYLSSSLSRASLGVFVRCVAPHNGATGTCCPSTDRRSADHAVPLGHVEQPARYARALIAIK